MIARNKGLWAAALLLSSTLADACNYHGGTLGIFDGSFRARYPKSSVVYFAILDAVEQGLLERSAFEPAAAGTSGYWNAAARLDDIARRLSAAGPAVAPAVALVFIESDLWARYEPGPRGYAVSVHAPGPRERDAIVVTSEAGIAAVLAGRLPAAVALERELIAIDGDDAARTAIPRLLLRALDPALSSGPASARNAPVRLFGPAR